MASWSPQQDAAIKAIGQWMRDPRRKQVFRLFGYAGTGKTTLAKEIAASVGGGVLFGAFTGKAALVLRQKGCGGATTIHSMIYKPEDDVMTHEPKFVLNYDSDVRDANLVIIDEVSMVDEKLGGDLLSFGRPVLVIGDPAQLPPVRGAGFFTNVDPDVMLTEVHRQARESGIIRLATDVREGRSIAPGDYGDVRVITRPEVNSADVLGADQVLVGLNKTRINYNKRIRELLKRGSPMPVVGDRVVCLRNNREKTLLNGSLWTVASVPPKGRKKNVIKLVVVPEGAPPDTKGFNVKVREEFWLGTDGDLEFEQKRGTDEFTYGYALTCHKSQGSQWDIVTVFDEAAAFRNDAWRWRYTAITRAAKKLTVVLPGA